MAMTEQQRREHLFVSMLVLNTEASSKTIQAITLTQTQGLKAGAENLALAIGDNLAMQFMLLGALGFKSQDIKELIEQQTKELRETYKHIFEQAQPANDDSAEG